MSAPITQSGGASPAPPATAVTTAPSGTNDIPSPAVLTQAAKLSVQQDKPILLDYYLETATGKACLGEDNDTKEKVLVKNVEEYTSLIQKIFKAAEDYLIVTENSIYVVSGKIQKKKIAMASLKDNGN
jgi:hypothetical protein